MKTVEFLLGLVLLAKATQSKSIVEHVQVQANDAAHPSASMTVYRITPRNYTGLTNLDSGNARGDVFFGIYELAIPELCRGSQARGLPQCQNIPILSIPNFNVYEQFTVEYDTRFGHYNECNPDPHTGIFECTPQRSSHGESCWYDNPQWKADFASECQMSECTCEAVDHLSVGMEPLPFGGHPRPANWPQQCASKYTFLGNVGLNITKPTRLVQGVKDVGACCDQCTNFLRGFGCKAYSYYEATEECQLFFYPKGTTKNDPAVQSAYNSGGGGGGQSLFNLISDFATTMNGTWYSMQEGGECKPGQTVGVDCYWKVVEMTRNVNASCVNGNVVDAIVKHNASCWDGCGPDSKNMSSTCWINCLFDVITGNGQSQPAMSETEILAPFEASFATDDPAQGGCPTIPACPAPCHPPTVAAGDEVSAQGRDEGAPGVAPVATGSEVLAPSSPTSLEEALAVLQMKTLDNCNPVAWDFCCEVGTKCDCTKGIDAPGQCKTDSYDFCCGIGKVCDCTTPPPSDTVA